MSDHELIYAAKAVLHAWDAQGVPDGIVTEDLFEAINRLRQAVTVIREVVP